MTGLRDASCGRHRPVGAPRQSKASKCAEPAICQRNSAPSGKADAEQDFLAQWAIAPGLSRAATMYEAGRGFRGADAAIVDVARRDPGFVGQFGNLENGRRVAGYHRDVVPGLDYLGANGSEMTSAGTVIHIEFHAATGQQTNCGDFVVPGSELKICGHVVLEGNRYWRIRAVADQGDLSLAVGVEHRGDVTAHAKLECGRYRLDRKTSR